MTIEQAKLQLNAMVESLSAATAIRLLDEVAAGKSDRYALAKEWDVYSTIIARRYSSIGTR